MATYALIPGGGGDPCEWHRLVPELASRGHDAIAVRLPAEDDTAGWSEYADAVVDVLTGISRDAHLRVKIPAGPRAYASIRGSMSMAGCTDTCGLEEGSV